MAKDDYFADAVAWAVENDITNGIGDGRFGPFDNCTRAQMVTFLWRAAGQPDPSGDGETFSDVADGQYYTKAAHWAVESGITNGIGGGLFGTNDTVTRSQAVTFLFRLAKAAAVEGDIPFLDVDRDTWYTEAVQWAVANGITNGTGENTFSPNDPCLRAQIVTFLYRYFAE